MDNLIEVINDGENKIAEQQRSLQRSLPIGSDKPPSVGESIGESVVAGPHEPSGAQEGKDDATGFLFGLLREQAKTDVRLAGAMKQAGLLDGGLLNQWLVPIAMPEPAVKRVKPEGGCLSFAHPAAVHVFEDDGSVVGEVLVVPESEWVDVEFEVALDSGSIVHVCRDSDTPGYDLKDSAGSRRGQNFLVGNGGIMPNLGEKRLSMQVPNGASDTSMIASVFQTAQATRPLMSVGRVCD